jgi:hypothetical protein
MTADRFSAQGELDAMAADYHSALSQQGPLEALNRWYFDMVGYRPSDEEPGLTVALLARQCREYMEEFASDTGSTPPPLKEPQ